MKINRKIIFGLILVIFLAILVSIFIFILKTKTAEDRISQKEIIIKSDLPSILYVNNAYRLEAFLFDLENQKEENITDKANWSVDNEKIVSIGNKSIKGQVLTKNEGDAGIIVTYGSYRAKLDIKIKKPELEVECAPRIVRNDGVFFEKTAKVGEKIEWVSVYNKIGSPNYIYQWSGTDNLRGDTAIVEKVYDKPGLKEVIFFTQDIAGVTAEANCSIIIVE